MGTLGKAVGSAGGFVAGSETLIDHLINSARSFIFSTAPGPAAVAAARAGIELIGSEEGKKLQQQLLTNLAALKVNQNLLTSIPTKNDLRSAIMPIILGEEERALAAAEKLKAAGFLVPAIRYPTVARGKARLRVTLSAAHTHEQINGLSRALAEI
jgi:7-keto-8-aminopelargonate synthetase-like enzyme